MKKMILLCVLAFANLGNLMAQDNGMATKHQYLLIFRFKANFVAPSQAAVQDNIKKWQAYMGSLGQSGALLNGYRPTGDGKTISGTAKTVKDSVYMANNELVSSFIIIKATDMNEAGDIASKCPIFEFDGSVEIRPLMETAQ